MTLKNLSLISILLIFSFVLVAEEELSLEQAYISNQAIARKIQFEVISTQSKSDEIEQMMRALQGIERLISKELSKIEQEKLAEVLWDLGLKGTGIVIQREGQFQRNLMQIRNESTRLMGELGGEAAARCVVQVMRTEHSPVVLAQAARSAAKIMPSLLPENDRAKEMDKLMVQEMVNVMKNQNNRSEDGHYALGFLDAVNTIGQWDNELVMNEELLKQILLIVDTSSGYNRLVRSRGWEVLEMIQGLS